MDRKVNVLIEKRNSEVFLRPRFTIDLDINYKELLQRFSDEFKKGNSKITGNIVDGHVFIKISKKHEHFWSPQLHLEIIQKTVKTSLLKGLFGPKPAVWTLFMFVHFIIGISFLAFCILLYTKFSLNESIFFPLLMMIILPLIWLLLYFLGKIGKNTGKYQMRNLHDFMIEIIEG
ncbi:GTP-binding protein [Polaribacter vadi]|uniref:GTP-binding protein n=1 Tax=Polaribacter TaxID=52959 RepID=UPI001C0851C6|nr:MULTISPECIES: GTP-binding protein [Polaribacter]MBU3010279.1 GTP-binding protein [Polaribacter vadi]MDO6740085.1 GTP-binding protein [Polaribacter sp. 1_MG-2023]